MNYEFSLSKIALISVVAGSVVFALLLFAAGLVVGSEWLGSASAATSDSVAKNEKAEGPTEPVLNDEEPAPKKAAPKKGSDQKQAPAEEPVEGEPEDAAPAATAQEVSLNGGVQIIREAATDANGEAVESEPEYVTVQVGVFLNQEEANRLLKDIERKGYAPSFFSGRDAEARQWYAVRIGAYSDRQQAANAAANFTRQEKLKAVVRPVRSL
jgi:septal ring-binding cell division protein DamX